VKRHEEEKEAASKRTVVTTRFPSVWIETKEAKGEEK